MPSPAIFSCELIVLLSSLCCSFVGFLISFLIGELDWSLGVAVCSSFDAVE